VNPRARCAAIVALACVLMLAAGCGHRTAKIVIHTSPQINGGLLLPVDVIATNQDKEKEILKIGPDQWFQSELRQTLSEKELMRLALKGGEPDRSFKFKGPKGTNAFIVFADYQGVTERESQQQTFYPRFGHKKMILDVHGDRLEMREKKKKKKAEDDGEAQ